MRISDWSSDVCSSDLVDLTAEQIIGVATAVRGHVQACFNREAELLDALADGTLTAEMIEEGWPNEPVSESTDRKSVVSGKSVSVRVDLGGCRIIKTKKTIIDSIIRPINKKEQR